MSNVLERIVEHKREELKARKANLPLEEFVDSLTPSGKSFYDALKDGPAGYILECKKASPSKGLIREDFDLDEIIHAYAPQAACISVLTDEKYFQGHYDYLEYVARRVRQPVLNKDFFIDPYQVHLARRYQADAILLMLSVLDDEQYTELADLAAHYQLDVLTEVSNEEETRRAIRLNARIIGINNRNLRDLSTDLAMTEKLVPLIRDSQHECVIISESGIYTHQDVQRLAPLVDGFLVGSSLMAEKDLPRAVNRLVFGPVKVCGITREQDVRAARQAGASYAGLIFHPGSKRAVSLHQAQDLVMQMPFHYVGVFVDAPLETVLDTAQLLDLDAVQLHGSEDQVYINDLRARLPGHCQIWKALGVTDTLPAMDYQHVDRILLDCKVGQAFGGTGQQFDWHMLDGIKDKSRLVLAGGLNPQNIRAAAATGVGMLDINSGVESTPGIKDTHLLEQAFSQLRQY